ncbi:hypothetical protein E4U55_007218 [Claviceps digitariae]|nr:hypothetical protein E4U55_007218 [Claviceps digitariae]
MAKKAKARLVNARLISMAMTGFFYTFKRPRTAPLMGMMKYDPIGKPNARPFLFKPAALTQGIDVWEKLGLLVRKKVLFLETKKKSK